MVLESLITPQKAERRPVVMIVYGIIYALVASVLALVVFKGQSSWTFVFFTALAAVPLLWRLMRIEEKKDFEIEDEVSLLKEHAKAMEVMMYLFIGIVIASAALFSLLPANQANALFKSQSSTLNTINPHDTVGRVVDTEFKLQLSSFNKIFFNNLKVLTFCMLFSFVFGAGAIFVLSWNASVIGAAIGNFISREIAALVSENTFNNILHSMGIVFLGFVKYVIHGVPEIAAYIIAALAAGIVSWAAVKHDLKSKRFERIVLDASDLILLSLVVLFIAGILEVWVTPLIF
jgi:uncharacterized membrane protein SpoIIM required for sporulation